jgi:hypothetical protein
MSEHEMEPIEEPGPEDLIPEEEIKAPFTFKLMIFLVVLYLGWRLVQGVMWVIERL